MVRYKHADFAGLLAADFNRINHTKIGSVWGFAGFETQSVLRGSCHFLYHIPQETPEIPRPFSLTFNRYA
jgi:hypothetical protein